MPVPAPFQDHLTLPVVCAPMFLVSSPELVIAQCKAGVIGTMPSLNIRPQEDFEPCLSRIRAALEAAQAADPAAKIAPFGVNLICHKTNTRLPQDLEACVAQRVPLVITSLGISAEVISKVQAYGGKVFHDVTNMYHARKAIAGGVDGVILVATGAGGHAGKVNPIALVRELRAEYSGTILLSGAIADGAGILAALAAGADLAYIGSRFIPTLESSAADAYKQMVLEATSADIVYTSAGTGVPANYLRPSFLRQGIDPDGLEYREAKSMAFASGEAKAKAWRDIWGCGQGIGIISEVQSTAAVVAELAQQFAAALEDLNSKLSRGALAMASGRAEQGRG